MKSKNPRFNKISDAIISFLASSRYINLLRACIKHRNIPLIKYIFAGQKPWSIGYREYKNYYINSMLENRNIIDRFNREDKLPKGYGYHLDERVIEYPWVYCSISGKSSKMLDAGGTLNHSYLLKLLKLVGKEITFFSLDIGKRPNNPDNYSYVCGDLRTSCFGDGTFDEIVCISTIEHIGMDNTFLYVNRKNYREAQHKDYEIVIREFNRLLINKGRLLLTVPFGKHLDLGWMQQFDKNMLNDLISVFGGKVSKISFYRYFPSGWQIATMDSCMKCEYFDIHSAEIYDSDLAAAARAVACIELQKC